MPLIIRLAFFVLAIALTVLIFIAMPSNEASAAIEFLTRTPWGQVTALDLYIGFVLSGALIIAFERNIFGVLTALVILVLGNVITALWFAWRWPDIVKSFQK